MDYGYIKAGYAPLETGWYSVSDCLPLMDDYSIGGIMRSRPVLLYLGDCQLVGYLQQWEDKEYAAEWKLSGRNGYNAKNVTHWQWLPLPPNAGAEARHKTSPSTALLACLDTLQRLTDRVDMVLRGVAEQTEMFGLVDEAKEVLNGKEQI